MFGFSLYNAQRLFGYSWDNYIEADELRTLALLAEIEDLKKALLEKDAEIASLRTGQEGFPFTFRT